MEAAVLWIYQEVKHHGIPIEAGQKPALCLRGRKHALCLIASYPVRVLKRPVKEFDRARRVIHRGEEYSILRALDQFSEIGSRNGMTERARRLLAKIRERAEVDEGEFEDEEEAPYTGPSLEPPPSSIIEVTKIPIEGRSQKRSSGGSNLLATICAELKIEGAVARRKLRKAGLSAPYDDETKIREALR